MDAINIALSNLLLRSIRDLHGLIDVQHAEKINILSKMKENGASRNKLIETEKNNDHDNLSHISSELLKILFILSAIKISKIDLLELPHQNSGITGVVKGIDDDVDDEEDDDDDDDEENNTNNQLLLFTTKIKHWLNTIVQFSILFICCFHSFRLYINDIENIIEDHIILLSKDHHKYIELDILKSKFYKLISKLLITSFCDILSNYNNNSSGNSIVDGDNIMNTIKHVIQKTYEDSNNDWNEVFIYQNNDDSVTTYIQQLIPHYKSIINKWIQHPILTIMEAHEYIDKYDNNNNTLVIDNKITNTMTTTTDTNNTSSMNIIKNKDDEKQALKDRSQALQKEAQEREKELIESLELKIEKKKIDLQARLAQKREKKEKEKVLNNIVNSTSNNISGNSDNNDNQNLSVIHNEDNNPESNLLLDNEIELVEKELLDIEVAHNEVKSLITTVDIEKLDIMNADILMAVVNKKISGMKVEIDDIITIQKDLENKELKSKNDKIMQKHLESEEKLNIAMELKKAKNQQNLQQRLLNRKKKML